LIDLPPLTEISRNDLYELALYTDASTETELFIQGGKGTVFSLEDQVSIVTPLKTVNIVFTLLDGEAEFRGHIFRGNRPCQKVLAGYAAFDWKISLRTLRRTGSCRLKVTVS
jgi:hypothetical protein